jgi:hypothetical protein
VHHVGFTILTEFVLCNEGPGFFCINLNKFVSIIRSKIYTESILCKYQCISSKQREIKIACYKQQATILFTCKVQRLGDHVF